VTLRIVSCSSFQTGKSGADVKQGDDAFSLSVPTSAAELLAFAVSDGATDSFKSGLWADLLVEMFTTKQIADICAHQIEQTAKVFRRSFDIATLPWYVQEKASNGSFASLLGLIINPAKSIANCVSVGDSCLVIAHPTSTKYFPKAAGDPAFFTNSPLLIPSHPSSLGKALLTKRRFFHRFLPGTTALFMMTDALGQWFVLEDQKRAMPRSRLMELASNSEFDCFVADCREQKTMRDDDVTLIRLVTEVTRD